MRKLIPCVICHRRNGEENGKSAKFSLGYRFCGGDFFGVVRIDWQKR